MRDRTGFVCLLGAPRKKIQKKNPREIETLPGIVGFTGEGATQTEGVRRCYSITRNELANAHVQDQRSHGNGVVFFFWKALLQISQTLLHS